MSTVFVEAVRNFMMPGGGQAGTGEIVSLDPATAASRIASGDAVSSGAPGAFVPAPTTRVKMTGAHGSIMVKWLTTTLCPRRCRHVSKPYFSGVDRERRRGRELRRS
jgi:hypothetical protein